MVNSLQEDRIRELAFLALQDIYKNDAYSDIALERVLQSSNLTSNSKNLVSELVYGIVRRRRYLDAVIDQLGKKTAKQQPPNLRIILHLGLYQLIYLDKVIKAIAVSSSVELAKKSGLSKLAGVVNGLLRTYERKQDCLVWPKDPITKIATLESFPDWLVAIWLEELGLEETIALCKWYNQPPNLDLRINPLQTSKEEVESALKASGLTVTNVDYLPQALRIVGKTGAIQELPGYNQGWWIVQDSSAQLVTHLLSPQPGETIIDACAAPGGKTTHIAELMEDQGEIWACDRHKKRLNKVEANAKRLQLTSITTQVLDSTQDQLPIQADRVLVDVPCSGNGTLHKRPDLRWRHTPTTINKLVDLQKKILTQATTWVKPGGILVYSTCTLNQKENEEVIKAFLENNPQWRIYPPEADSFWQNFATPEGWIKIWPHIHQMDGFFLVRLVKSD